MQPFVQDYAEDFQEIPKEIILKMKLRIPPWISARISSTFTIEISNKNYRILIALGILHEIHFGVFAKMNPQISPEISWIFLWNFSS